MGEQLNISLPVDADVTDGGDTINLEYVAGGKHSVVKIPDDVIRRAYAYLSQLRDREYWDGYFDRMYHWARQCE